MRAITTLFVLFGICLGGLAQQLTFSNLPRINARAHYNKIIGENTSGIFMLRFRYPDLKKLFDIEHYSHNLDYINERSIKLDRHERLAKIATTDSGLAVIVIKQKGYSAEISLYKLNNNLEINGKSILLFQSDKVKPVEESIDCEFSNNKNCFFITIETISEEGLENIHVLSFKSNGTPLANTVIKTDFRHKDAYLGDLCITHQGNAACILSKINQEKKLTDPSYISHFIVYLNQDQNSGFKLINGNKFFMSSTRLVENEFNGNIYLLSFYSFKNPNDNTGIVFGNWNPRKTYLSNTFSAIDRKLVTMVLGAASEKKGEDLSHFFFRKLVPRSDGGMLAVAEKYTVTQQLETFFINGLPQTSSRNIYNYDDLIVFTFDSIGKFEWKHHIPKRQNSLIENNYFSSVAICVNEDKINLIYNENPAQNNRVLLIKLTRDGTMEQRILLKSDNLFTAVIPFESKQTGYNRLVLPLMQNRQIYLLKITTGS